MLVERNESRTTIQARIGGSAKPRGDSCFRNFRSSSNMERKTPTKTIWWPQPGAFELTEFKSTIVLLADWVPGPAGGPPAGARRPESRCGATLATGTKCDVDVTLIIFASFRPGSDTRRSGGRQYRAAVARSPRRCTRLAGPLPRTPDNAARTGSHSRAARNQMVPKRLSACSAERARPPCFVLPQAQTIRDGCTGGEPRGRYGPRAPFPQSSRGTSPPPGG